MLKYHTWKRTSAAAVAAALVLTGILGASGCGRTGAGTEDASSGSGTENKEETAMGRYLEEDVNLPENCQQICTMRFLEDGTLRICYNDENFEFFYADSKDQGNTWSEGTDFLTLLGLDKNGYSVSYPQLAKDGGIFLNVTNEEEADPDQGKYGVHFYYVDPEGNFRELTGASALAGYITEAKFTDNGTIILNLLSDGLAELSLTDGTVKNEYEKGNFVNYFCVDKKRLITVTDTLHYYDLETGEPMEDATALTEQITSDDKNLQLTSTSSWPVVFAEGDEDDSLFFADSSGLYRYSFKGSVVEQVIDGSLNSIGSPDTYLVSMESDKDGNFYLAVTDGVSGEGKLLKYVYSADTPATPDTELTVYSLRDNSYMRQIAALFQKKYPDIYLNYETGMSEEDAVTSTDALKNLNTEIMAGNGPDVLIMDGIPEETYIEKGMLADLSDILDATNKEDGLLDNIRSAYQKEDGSQYVMPVRFAIPMIQGNAEDVAAIKDLKTMADIVEKHQSEYSESCIPMTLMFYGTEAFLKSLADVNAPAWIKEDGTLDEKAVTEYLKEAGRMYQAGKDSMEALKKQYENMGVDVAYLGEGDLATLKDISGGGFEMLSGAAKLSAGGLKSPSGLAFMYSVEQKNIDLNDALWNGQAENCFIPVQNVGISAKASQPEAAEKLISFMLSQEGQQIGKDSGFPVNETVYDSEEYWAVGDSDGSLGTMGGGTAGSDDYIELDIKRADEAKTEEIRQLGKTLTTPSDTNEIILNAVADAGSRYLDGEISLEEAAKAAIQQVNLYLSE